ncbi:MAG: NAD-dependent epimerase/dehydratase family protein [Rhodospirillales bacterium]
MILVTGATGFVGSSLVRLLLARGEVVRVLVRPGSDHRNLTGLDVDIAEGDLLKPETLKAAVAGCQGLYHVAADYRLWTRNPDQMFEANVDGSQAIIRAAADAGVWRMVYTSSVAVMGIIKGGVADEQTPVSYRDMIGVYKQSKFKAEEAVQKLIDDEGVPVVIVNPSTPIGPRDIKPTPTGRMIVEAAAGRMPAFVDTGLNIAHVDDVAAGHILAFDKGQIGERYILGGTDMELSEILAHIAHLMNRKSPTLKIPHNAILPIAYLAEAWTRISGGDDPFVLVDGVKMAKKKMFFSSAKAIRELGYQARPAGNALDDAVKWFQVEGYF